MAPFLAVRSTKSEPHLGHIPVELCRLSESGHKDFIFLQISAFKNILGSRWLDNKKLATAWMESPLRRSYTGIEFAPEKPKEGKYNLWQGHPVKSVRGDCSLFLDHIHSIICDSNDEYTHYFISWLANIIRKPEQKPGTAIVIRGKQGTGKSFVFKHFGKLLGAHYKVADNERYISGRFNSHLHDCLLLHLEEAFFAGDKKLEAALKEMITGDQILMEYKGKEPVLAKNYARVVITKNSTWVIPAGLEERRFFVLDAQDHEMQNKDYFSAIAAQLNNGGYEALMHYLMNYKYDEADLRDVPKTEALLEQKLQSLNHEQQWWLEVLQKGGLPKQDGWTGICGTRDMFRDYCEHASISGKALKEKQALDTGDEDKIKHLEKEIKNLMNALKMGIVTPTVQAELKALEEEKEKYEKRVRVEFQEIEHIHAVMPAIKQSFIDILNCERPVPVAHVAKLRSRIQMILGQNIRISPKEGNKGLIAEIQSQYKGLLKLSGLSDDKLNLVAGVGFEPTTFRL